MFAALTWMAQASLILPYLGIIPLLRFGPNRAWIPPFDMATLVEEIPQLLPILTAW